MTLDFEKKGKIMIKLKTENQFCYKMNNRFKFRNLANIIISLIFVMMLGGCGSMETADISSKGNVTIFDDGHIEADMVEVFDQSYYKESELMDMVKEEVTTYNLKKGGEPIKVLSDSMNGNTISVTLSFENTDCYNDYMPEQLFIGTVEEADAAGYDFNRSLYIVGKGEATIGKNDLKDMGNSKLIILDGEVTLRVPSKIAYYSQGMTLLDDNTVDAEGSDCYFVILK